MRHSAGALAAVIISATAVWSTTIVRAAPAADSPREEVISIVAKIQRADYQNDSKALRHLYEKLKPYVEEKEFGSRVRYWRGFALWRRGQNAMQESGDQKEIEQDLTLALDEFKAAEAADPAFLDAKTGAISCVGNIMYLNRENEARLQELAVQVKPMIQEARTAAPDDPRLIWVLGPILWNMPPERGGGQDKAIESYQKGLETWRKQKGTVTDPLEPTWGEPELYMSISWSYLNRTEPDLDAAEKYARLALRLVPYWHYTRDILFPQIQAAQHN